MRTLFRVGDLRLAEAAKARAANLRPVAPKLVALIRDRTATEFLQQGWHAPDGSFRPWHPLQPWPETGEAAVGRKLMLRSGALFRALMGRGSGSVVRMGERSVEVGVSAAQFPQAAILRGGSGARISERPVVIRAKKRVSGGRGRRGSDDVRSYAMFWYLGLTFGVWLSGDKLLRRGIVLYPRPYMTRHPILVQRAGRIISRYIAKGAA